MTPEARQAVVDDLFEKARSLNDALMEAARAGIRSSVRGKPLHDMIAGLMVVELKLYEDLYPSEEAEFRKRRAVAIAVDEIRNQGGLG